MKRQHILIMHMHIHPLTLHYPLLTYSERTFTTSTWPRLAPWCDKYYQIKTKQSREQSKAKTAILIFIFILSLNQIKSNKIKDTLLDSDDNLLYDSDSIWFDLIWFDFIWQNGSIPIHHDDNWGHADTVKVSYGNS